MIDYQSIIEHVHSDLTKRKNYAEVASYIPELACEDAESFGVCLTTVDGQKFHTGDWTKQFSTQRKIEVLQCLDDTLR